MKYEPRTLGILGGGQLGRMSALAAGRLGIRTYIYTPEEDSPASHVAARTFVGAYEDRRRLKAFAQSVDVISYEFENIPVETIRYLQKFKPVYPDDRLLEIAQNRVKEKKFLNDIGVPTARWAAVASPADVRREAAAMDGADAFVLKTVRFGYDGKGQTFWTPDQELEPRWAGLKSNDIILEEKLDFACEISIIIARDRLGQTAIYGPVLNEHRNHILSRSTVPAAIPAHMAGQAREMARLLADAVDLVGVLALELFVTRDGRILANEIAPRPHNSGHWTIDACTVSQFEQHVRTVCSLPVGLPGRHSDAVMINLLGADVRKLAPYLEMKNACIHLYGKHEVREGRKLGHVTLLKPREADSARSLENRE